MRELCHEFHQQALRPPRRSIRRLFQHCPPLRQFSPQRITPCRLGGGKAFRNFSIILGGARYPAIEGAHTCSDISGPVTRKSRPSRSKRIRNRGLIQPRRPRREIYRQEGWVRRHMRKYFWQRWHNRKGRFNALRRLLSQTVPHKATGRFFHTRSFRKYATRCSAGM